MRILLVNDDGIDSPALLPTVKILERIGTVTTVVPAENQSWTSKSNSRRKDKIEKRIVHLEGRKIITLDALPADCANYGLYLDDKPDLLVSGANVGHNVGLSAYLSSGTVGAAMEGVLAGIPSISVSVPYTYKIDELYSDEFVPSLEILEKLVIAFMDNKPDNFAMLMVNLPIKHNNAGFQATFIERWIFGQLFIDRKDHIIPIEYPKLNKITKKEPHSDTWARSKGYNSIVVIDPNAQVIDRKIVELWLEEKGLRDTRK
ncbi:MAG: 5'/3'-nucleotidase SurE [Candidatus Heimdallarchaeota archaeon]|nr:5'/3'-nucleotidase SurE [Candidatus Heimdallarchaeota archaeon]